MTSQRRRAALVALVAALIGAAGHVARAQSISLSIPTVADSIAAAPPMLVTATGISADLLPITVRLEVSRDPTFQTPLFVGTAHAADTSFTLDRLLPERTMVSFRVTLFDRNSRLLAQQAFARPVRSWIRLGGPGSRPNDVLFTRRPAFVWSPSSLTLPPGPWTFDLTVFLAENNQPFSFAPGISETTFVFPQALDASTQYRWRLHARAQNSAVNDEITVTSQTSFSIASSEQPTATLLYQNFPNPFGGVKPVTCFWFDLAHRSRVRLTIYDLRLREVKNIIDGQDLPAGAYGRLRDVALGGCDGRYLWDGTDDRGRTVPQGSYIAVLDADGKRDTKKMFYHGR